MVGVHEGGVATNLGKAYKRDSGSLWRHKGLISKTAATEAQEEKRNIVFLYVFHVPHVLTQRNILIGIDLSFDIMNLLSIVKFCDFTNNQVCLYGP